MSLSPTFTPEEFAEHLAAIQKYDPEFLYKSWTASAIYFRTLAEKGIDISDTLEALQEIYAYSNNIHVMEHAAHALVRHYLNTKDYLPIITLTENAQYPSYYLIPIKNYHKDITLPDSLLQVVVDFLVKEKYLTHEIIKNHLTSIRNDVSPRIDKIIELVYHKFKTERPLTELLAIFAAQKLDIQHHLHFFVEAFHSPKRDFNLKSDFLSAASSGVNIEALIPDLIVFLEDAEIGFNIAYSIAFHYTKTLQFDALNSLLNHSSVEVINGAVRAVASRYYNHIQRSDKLVFILLTTLTNHNIPIQYITYNLIKEGIKNNNILPIQNHIPLLLQALDSTTKNKVIIPFLTEVMQKDKTLAKEVLDLLEQPQNAQTTLKEICIDILEDKFPKTCSICETIPREKSYTSSSSVPDAVELLEPQQNKDDVCNGILRTCPNCNAFYFYKQTQEEDYDYMRTEVSITVQRLFTAELLSKLEGQQLENYQTNLEQQLQNHKRNLEHPTWYIQKDASYALLIYYLSIKDNAAIVSLLQHHNESVVKVVIDYYLKHFLNPTIVPHQDIIDAIENSLNLETCKKAAASLTTSYALLQEKDQKVQTLLTSPIREIKEGAIIALCQTRLNKLDGFSPFLEEIKQAFLDEEGEYQRYASYILTHCIKNKASGFDAKEFILKQLDSTNNTIINNTLQLVKIYIEKYPEYSWAIKKAGKHLKTKEITYYALDILKHCATNNFYKEQMLLYLQDALKQPPKAYVNEMLNFIYSIYNDGVNIDFLIPDIVNLLCINQMQHKSIVLTILTKALKNGFDFTFAEDNIRQADMGRHDSYDQDITYILTDIYLRNDNNEALNSLFLDKNKSRRSAAIAYLNKYPNKDKVNIAGFIEAIIANLNHDYFYMDREAKIAIEYFKNRSLEDKNLIEEYLS